MAFVLTHTSGISNSTGTTVAPVLAAEVAAGNLLVLSVGSDNTSTTAPTVTTISKPGGETAVWVKIAGHNSTTATVSGGTIGSIWAIVTTVAWASGTTITATVTASVPKKAATLLEFSGTTLALRGTAGTGTSTSGVPTSTTSGTAPVAGDLVLGMATFESPTAAAADADTTNGSWSARVTALTTGTTTAALGVITQYKVVTAGGQQTYNPVGTADSGSAVVALIPAPVQVSTSVSTSWAVATPVYPALDTLGSSMTMWWQADKITGKADGALLANGSVQDFSGHLNHLTGRSVVWPPYRATLGPNGTPCWDHTGTTGGLYDTNPTPNTPTGDLTFFAVIKTSPRVENQNLCFGWDSEGVDIHLMPDLRVGIGVAGVGTDNVVSTITLPTDTWTTLLVTMTPAGNAHFDIDGVTEDVAVTGNPVFAAGTGSSFGMDYNGTGPFRGLVAEVGMYPSVLSPVEIDAVIGTLNAPPPPVPVTTAIAASWTVLERVVDTVPTSWATSAKVTDTAAILFATKARVTDSAAISWATKAATAVATRLTTWTTKAKVTDPVVASWTTKATITDAAPIIWSTKAVVTAPRPISWSTKVAVAASRATSWAVSIIETLGSVTASRSASWATKTKATASRPATWATKTTASTARSASWATRARLIAARPISWATKARLTASASVSWSVSAVVTAITSTSWTVLESLSALRAALWNVASQVVYTVVKRPVLTITPPTSALMVVAPESRLTINEPTSALSITPPEPGLTITPPPSHLEIT